MMNHTFGGNNLSTFIHICYVLLLSANVSPLSDWCSLTSFATCCYSIRRRRTDMTNNLMHHCYLSLKFRRSFLTILLNYIHY